MQTDSTVACWGAGTTVTGSDPDYGQALPPADLFTQLSAGQYHTCGVKSDGTVACWGDHRYGQLGPTLTVTKAGNGTGTVTSDPAGVDCGTTCTTTYPPLTATAVELTATPAAGSTFAGWSGACSGTGACAVTMDAAKTVTATFTLKSSTYTVTVNKAGNGSGTVSGGGSYTAGVKVTLTAKADTGSTFAGWSPSPCAARFSMPANDLTCTATFTLKSYTVTAKAGTGGTITPATTVVDYGTTATFTVTPNAGYSIRTVTGCGGSLNGTTYTTGRITGACTVRANFTVNRHLLTVSKSGSGIVTSLPSGIHCGNNCSEAYNEGTPVTLTATAARGWKLLNWGGACEGVAPPTCALSMTTAQNVIATFVQSQ